MKRRIAIFVLVFVLLFPFSAALANSLPGYWEYGETGGSVFVPSGEDLAVRHERLSFDVTELGKGIICAANVSAQYRIANLSGEARTITMLFPIVFYPEDASSLAEDTRVLIDAQQAECSFLLMDFLEISPSERGGNKEYEQTFEEACK